MGMTCLLGQQKDLNRAKGRIVSPWSNPIPLKEYAKHPVVVYFYSDKWIPITCFSLAEAIALYRKALSLGKEILVYPPNLELGAQSLSERPPTLTAEIALLPQAS